MQASGREQDGRPPGRPSYIHAMRILACLLVVLLSGACSRTPSTLATGGAPAPVAISPEPTERHLRNVRQLTNGGENAEAYFSTDGQWLIFQSTRDGRRCDQEYVMRVDGSGL